ncbi:UDP-N-acetylmuramate--L-alanine ligase [Nitritalea halalkaliphila LW7]|uniref:UDP-N-acetylmuramate--L-alanine ligase n=1 Tax=Nitritalea halalkaliphila LW7 TaxID=1189621 RepID=I5C2D8_9BACT|nr:UDP-N-acetylmuramate--L-alanine ligase [Nitritalea halalkaliphila]EIM75990.1 UDP-N-acetylmuramate--L-alanine ligase [Nitritalea halalkaliphila LW7]
MQTDQLRYVYFLGIGGIGMSALARWFHQKGLPVSGYDRTPSLLTEQLQQEGIPVYFEDSVQILSEALRALPVEQVLVVWTPAVPASSQLLTHFRDAGYRLLKRAEVLGLLSAERSCLAVAGTHGKTTTSVLLAHLLHSQGLPVSAFLGGIAKNVASNLIQPQRGEETKATMVVEADEFDRSFLHLHPTAAVITSADADHLDIYKDAEQLLEAFRLFAGRIRKKGMLLLQHTAAEKLGTLPLAKKVRVLTYGLKGGEVRAEAIRAHADRFIFDYHAPDKVIHDLTLPMPGYHNVENALPAITLALAAGLSVVQVRAALQVFAGVKRRFERCVQTEAHVYIDDYAHHPEEIRATLSSVLAMYPGKTLTVVFQPHLYSRTRDFAAGFSESLSLADRVWLLDIYPAREEPIPGVSAEMLIGGIQAAEKRLVAKEELLGLIRGEQPELLVTLGAGDIDRLVAPITALLTAKGGLDA